MQAGFKIVCGLLMVALVGACSSPPPSTLTLEPAQITLAVGTSGVVMVKLNRAQLTGLVGITLSGLPAGVSSITPTIAASASLGQLTLVVNSSAPVGGPYPISVQGSGKTATLALIITSGGSAGGGGGKGGGSSVNLNGLWNDNGRQVNLTQSGGSVLAQYVQPYICDFRDGSGGSEQTKFDFQATLSDHTLTGQTTVCSYGAGNPNGVGLRLADMTLTVSADGNSIKGTWHNTLSGQDEPITLTPITTASTFYQPLWQTLALSTTANDGSSLAGGER